MALRRTLILPLCAAVTLGAGCGGGGSGERLTKAEYAAKADAVCREFQAQVDELGEPQTLADLAALADKALPIVEEGVGKIRDLKPPEELQATVDEWIVTGDKSIKQLNGLRDAAKAKDRAAIQRVATEAQRNDEKSERLATKLGMTACAQDSDSG